MDETTTSAGDDSRFSRSLMALGEGPMEALAKARVIIFGIGGVGSEHRRQWSIQLKWQS